MNRLKSIFSRLSRLLKDRHAAERDKRIRIATLCGEFVDDQIDRIESRPPSQQEHGWTDADLRF